VEREGASDLLRFGQLADDLSPAGDPGDGHALRTREHAQGRVPRAVVVTDHEPTFGGKEEGDVVVAVSCGGDAPDGASQPPKAI
jgi:hypothetical protein